MATEDGLVLGLVLGLALGLSAGAAVLGVEALAAGLGVDPVLAQPPATKTIANKATPKRGPTPKSLVIIPYPTFLKDYH